jgi:Alginate lyase
MKSRLFVLIACALAILIPATARSAAPPRTFILDPAKIARKREDIRANDPRLAPALEKLKRAADAALTVGPFSVVHKKVTPPSGDKHDYMSYAPYWWPDRDKPGGLPYIRRDGEHSPDVQESSDRAELGRMIDSVETLALAYYFTGDEKYAEHARTLMRAWFIDPATRMNPSFEFAQAIRGRNTGRCYGLIDSHAFTRLIDAVGLLAESKAWTPDDDRALHAWFDKFLHWMLDTEMGRDEASRKNNHGTYYDVQVADYALFLGQPELARKVLNEARAKRIAQQIEPDGRQPLELARTKSWGYSLANLRGLMKLATLGDRVGIDLWHYQTDDGRSIRAAVEFLAPFSLDQKAWPYQQIEGFSPKLLYPLLRQAAEKYPDASFSSRASRLSLSPSDRENLMPL